MRLATVGNGTPDGQLVIVSTDGRRCTPTHQIVQTLQQALERWEDVQPPLGDLARRVEAGEVETTTFNPADALAPLPRAWQWLDGSAFQSHGDLMSSVFRTAKLPYDSRPLMYQGMSDRFLSGTDDVLLPSEDDGIDFEGEFGVIVDRVPMGVSAEAAAMHIRLIVLINDWSLRAIAPVEMKTGFGWIQAKPASAMAPIAITPEEMGASWQRSRVCLNLLVDWNGERFGAANGEPMAFGFDELVAHAARTRELVAGTVIGSGTVSNVNYREIGSSCIAERRGIEMLDKGSATTNFMQFGDRVRMEVFGPNGTSLFGMIDQCVVRSPGA